MKNIKFIACLFAATIILGSLSCTDMLDEEPRSELTPDYFKTAQGVRAGVIASYSGLRWLFGPDGALAFTIIGTDEFTTTDQMNSGQGAMDTYNNDYSPSNGTMGNYWNNGFQFINTCNGVLEYGEDADLTDAEKTTIFAEARFLRGLYYYLIAMNYGDAPLDLGSGKLKFNITPSTTSIRDSRADVLEAVIEDFTYAKNNLPDTPSETGRAAKPAAIHFLAKAYLSRASMEKTGTADYQKAYDTAMELINNIDSYKVSLQQNYADVHKEGNENAPEILFNVQRTWTTSGPNLVFEESNDGEYAVDNKGHRGNFFFTAGYENVQVNGKAIVPRSIYYQRPWRMFMPTKWLVFDAFADKENDARWDGSFRMEWNAGIEFEINGNTVKEGELAIRLSLENETPEPGDVVQDNGVIHKSNYVLYYWDMLYNSDGTYKMGNVEYIYPNLTKYDDTKRLTMNYDSNRPYILARLAETYLIAAEAAMFLGDTDEAAKQINVVRKRAAYRDGLTEAELNTAIANMEISGSDVTIDFILAERTREMCGESWRWMDLMRTGKLVERVKAYNVLGKSNIQEYHTLRPIPQGQIDLLSDPAQKATYQNPGY